jgi:hypothetical protein
MVSTFSCIGITAGRRLDHGSFQMILSVFERLAESSLVENPGSNDVVAEIAHYEQNDMIINGTRYRLKVRLITVLFF